MSEVKTISTRLIGKHHRSYFYKKYLLPVKTPFGTIIFQHLFDSPERQAALLLFDFMRRSQQNRLPFFNAYSVTLQKADFDSILNQIAEKRAEIQAIAPNIEEKTDGEKSLTLSYTCEGVRCVLKFTVSN